MGTTSLGIYYPDPSGVPKRQDIQDLATTTNAAILTAAPQSAWSTYSAAWTSSGTNPAIGNGSITGRYIQLGKTILFRVTITMGSSTTYGTGGYAVSLPVQGHTAGLQVQVQGEVLIGGTAYASRGRIPSSGTTVLLYCDPTAAGGGSRAVTPTTPGTLASGHSIFVGGSYEAL